ncbi:E3 ubiquitin-protein ligase UBR2-like [Clavelina lepadiformis]|uniref:E3 ubiquitin-protein ligase UBR2-like n=1 Tax=Clavelina lepadiformis TaxID=159417 RepID=UPI004042CF88
MFVSKPFDEDEFLAVVLDFIKDNVPGIIKSENLWSVGLFKDVAVKTRILDKIAWWLFEEDQQVALKKLQKNNRPGICGHIFKPGEATYTCRECAADSTCVFCQKCFRQSAHINHKHKLHSSAGGGCCDCGDVEAWKKHPFCNLHEVAGELQAVSGAVELDEALRKRAHVLFKFLLQYISDCLTSDHKETNQLPIYLQPQQPSDTYMAVVYNDESHTFDYVIDVLKHAISCSVKIASDFATIIDREGRTPIVAGREAVCLEAKQFIETTRSSRTVRINQENFPLKTKVIHVNVLAHQELSVSLLQWLNMICQECEDFRVMISDILTDKYEEDVRKTIVGKLMLADILLWKVARSSSQTLIMSSTLMQLSSKKVFAATYVKLYKQLMDDFLMDDHNHSDSITSMSVQLFTVPTVVSYLIAEEGLLQVILETIISACCISGSNQENDVPFKFDGRNRAKIFRRLQFCFSDLKYVLSCLLPEWNETLEYHFLSFFKLLTTFLSSVEGMDSVTRQVNGHLEYEPEWQTMVTLSMTMKPIIKKVLKWCSHNERVLNHCLAETVSVLKNLHCKETEKKITIKYNGTDFHCIDFDITSKPVSVHYPLTRFAAALLVSLGKTTDSLESVKTMWHIMDLAECSFRSLALCAQVSAGAWRRNGMSLANQSFYYRNYLCRSELFVRDIQMLQCCCALIEPNLFFVTLHHKLTLLDSNKMQEFHMPLYEELVLLLIHIYAERFTDGIGQISQKDIIKREIIHILASGPKPHSKIQKYLSHELSENPDWEKILHEVADFRPSSNTKSAARYELKYEYLQNISPYFYHYETASQQADVRNEVSQRKKAMNCSLGFTPQPLPSFTKAFSGIVYLLSATAFISLLKSILQNYLVPQITMSDRLLEKVLYLIGCGIVEERQMLNTDDRCSFEFCNGLKQSGILGTLKELQETQSVAFHQETILWTISKLEDVLNFRAGTINLGDIETSQLKNTNVSKLSQKQMVQKKREKLMLQMKQLQQKFVEKNAMSVQENSAPLEKSPESIPNESGETPVCTSLKWQLATKNEEASEICILCQDDSDLQDCFVVPAFVQSSSVLFKRQANHIGRTSSFVDIFNYPGVHVSTCSHILHYMCWQQYMDSLKDNRESLAFHLRRHYASFSVDQNEFLCPLCSCLSNCAIPVISMEKMFEYRGVSSSIQDSMTIHQWIHLMEEYTDRFMQEKDDGLVTQQSNNGTSLLLKTNTSIIESTSLESHEVDLDESDMVEQQFAGDQLEPALYAMIESFKKKCKNITDNFKNSVTAVDNENRLLWITASTTFQVQENISRYKNTPLLAPASVRTDCALLHLTRSCFAYAHLKKSELQSRRNECIQLLLGKHDECLLFTNIFSTFVQLMCSCQVFLEISSVSAVVNGCNILFLCSLAQIVQIMLCVDVEMIISENSEDPQSDLVKCFVQVRSYANIPTMHKIDHIKLENCLSHCFDPFLRCCVLFMHYMTKVPVPSLLKEQNDRICMFQYLGLPSNMLSYFDLDGNGDLSKIVQRWCSNFSPDVGDKVIYPDLIKVNTLVQLEEHYSDVIAVASDFKCPRFGSNSDSVSPTMCLICGVMLCSQSYCCQNTLGGINYGACAYHSYKCNYGCGIFLRSRDCTIFLLNENKGSFRSAPYLDEHGETDRGLRRGNPMKLNEERVKELNLIWLSHAIPEQIARDVEANRSLSNFNWTHF